MGVFEWAQIYHHLQIYYKLSLMIESSHKIWCYWNQTASGFLREWDTANSNRLSSFFPSKRARNWGAITTCYGDVVQSENRARLKPFSMPAIRDLHDSKSNAVLACPLFSWKTASVSPCTAGTPEKATAIGSIGIDLCRTQLKLVWLVRRYPLVNVYITMENHHAING